MPLSGNISSAAGTPGNKDIAKAYQPLLLCVFTWYNNDGTPKATLRLATHPLNTAEGGFQYGGNDYQARIGDQAIDAVQAMSDTGIDIPPTLTLQILDADRFIWANYEKVFGFKGATLIVTLVLWETDTANFSADSYVKFKGTCNPANLTDEATLTVSAGSKLNMQKVLLPVIPIQQRCPWIFPTDLGSRTKGHTDPDSAFYECGYSPDVAGGQGTLNGGVAYTTCGYTKADCVARGMYNSPVGHFGGVQWQPDVWWKGKSYTEGKTISGINLANEAKYREYVPLIYGKTFVEPVVLNVRGEANSTRLEALVCFGDVGMALANGSSSGGIKKVIVNDVEIPLNYNDKIGGAKPADYLFDWTYVNAGARDSIGPQDGPGWNKLSDPYGNMTAIAITYPKALGNSDSIPGVRVLLTGPKLRVYTSPGAYTKQVTSNPVWILMDLLVQANWLYTEFNIQTWIDAAAVCDVPISYTNNSGGTSTHPRYSCSLAIKQRRSAADIIRGIRNACKAVLVPNDSSGLLQIFIKQTFGDEQNLVTYPLGIPGSNNASGIASIHTTGVVTNGVSAYDFDESSILTRDDGSSTLAISQRAILNSPNRISANFQDADNQWIQDSITEVDPVDIGRSGQEVTNTVQADGINSYDQAKRIFEGIFAETYRGNPRGDSGGTLTFEFETTQKIAHLHVGHLCRFSHQQLGLTNQFVRVIKLQPSRDHETVKITLQWHDDNWYRDTYGQVGDPIYSSHGKDPLARPPLPWQPYQEQPLANDAVVGPTKWSFGMTQTYEVNTDGTSNATLGVIGKLPVNSFLNVQVQPPLIGLQGTYTPGAGAVIANAVSYYFVCSYDGSGKLSPPTRYPCAIATAAGDLNNSVTIPIVSWPTSGTITGWYVFGGYDPRYPTFQATGVGTPASITITTALNTRAYGQPDVMFDHLELRIKRQIHGGVWGAAINAVTATTLQFTGSTFGVNQWAGYDLTIIGRAGLSSSMPVWNLRIASNTADTLTVAGGTGNLTTLPSADLAIAGINVGDVAVMRALPTTFSSTQLGDANFINNIAGGSATTGLADESSKNYILRIYAGAGAGSWRRIVSNTATTYTVAPPFDNVPDATSRFWIESADFITLAKSSPLSNEDIAATYTGTAGISDYNGQTIIVQGVAVDANSNEGFEQDCPLRDFYIFGSAGNIPSAAALTAPANVTPGVITYKYQWPDRAQSTARRPTDLVLSVPYTKPLGWTGTGIHVYAEDPDQSAVPILQLDGTTALDTTSNLGGPWDPIDEGQFADDGSLVVTLKRFTIPNETKDIRVYLASYSASVDNKLVRANAASPTPSAVVTVPPPPTFASGEENAQNVTGFTASAAYGIGGNGQLVLIISASWTKPADQNFAGITLILLRPPIVTAPAGTRTAFVQQNQPAAQTLDVTTGTSSVVELSAFPVVTENDTLYALSYDINGRGNSYIKGVTPSAALTLSPPADGATGQEKTSLITSATAQVSYSYSADGVEMYGFLGTLVPPLPSIDPTFGGVALYLRNQAGAGAIDPVTGVGATDILLGYTGAGDLTFKTDTWPLIGTLPTWDMYFVSMDVNNKQNVLVPGTTPRVTAITPVLQSTGALKLNRSDPASLDASMAVLASKLAVNDAGVSTIKIASAAVITAKIAALNITTPLIADSNITTAKIANLAVTSALIANLAVGTAQIADLAVTDAKINNLSANKITAGTISAVTITTVTINGGAISGTSLTIASGGETVNIDGTNFVLVSNASGQSQVRALTIRTQNAANNRWVQMSSGGGISGQSLGGVTWSIGDGTVFSAGLQVVGQRQTDPAAPSGWADATAQTWAANLRTALRNHGLI